MKGEDLADAKAKVRALGKPLGGGTDGGLKGRSESLVTGSEREVDERKRILSGRKRKQRETDAENPKEGRSRKVEAGRG